MGDVTYTWTIRSEGKGYEPIKVVQTNITGEEHYIYGSLSGGDGKYGHYHFADTFYPTGSPNIDNEVSYVFGKINTDCSLSAEDINNPLQTIQIYPNPAHTHIYISSLPNGSTISITDISGRVLATHYNKSQSTLHIPVHHLSSGMYFVNISHGAHSINKKIVVGR